MQTMTVLGAKMGDARSDLVKVLAYIPGWDTARANRWFTDFEAHIKSEAEAGARSGAKSAVMPYLIGIAAISAAAVGLGLYGAFRK